MMSLDEQQADNAPRPAPPRFWWTKRVAGAWLVLLVALTCLHAGWGYCAQAQLQAEIDRCRRAGEPVFIEEFQPPAVPAAENAAIPLDKAAMALISTLTQADWDVIHRSIGRSDSTGTDRPKAGDSAKLDNIVAANQQVLVEVCKARSMSGCDWGVPISSPGILAPFPHLSPQRKLCVFLHALARRRHHTGDHAGAVEAIRDIVRVATAIHSHPQSVITYLVGRGIDALALAALTDMTPALAISERRGGDIKVPQPAGREQIEGVIADLLEEGTRREGIVEAHLGERGIWQFYCCQLVVGGEMSVAYITPWNMNSGPAPLFTPTPLESVWVYLVSPMLVLDATKVMRSATSLINAARKPNWPAARDKVPPAPGWREYYNAPLTRPLSAALLDEVPGWTLQNHFGLLAGRRILGIALAMRLYTADHGREPRQLDELVPTYLPHLPEDPFAADGRAIAYRPDGVRQIMYDGWVRDADGELVPIPKVVPRRPRPVLYSIGPDGVDQRGTPRFDASGYLVCWDCFRDPRDDRPRGDLVFCLDGQPVEPPPRPTPQPFRPSSGSWTSFAPSTQL